jgi:fused signal recognition particle receptor
VPEPVPAPDVEDEPALPEIAPGDPVAPEPTQPSPSPEQVTRAVSEEAPAGAPVIPESPVVVEVRDVEPAGLPEQAFVPSEPVEVPLAPREPRTLMTPVTLGPPEPRFAGPCGDAARRGRNNWGCLGGVTDLGRQVGFANRR